MTNRTALIAGATGLVGGHCLKLLLKEPAYRRVIAIARRPLDAGHPRLTVIIRDFATLDGVDFAGVTDVFCSLGSTIRKAGSREAFRQIDSGYPVAIAEKAIAAGANRFLVVSSVGAEPGSPNFYLRVKAGMEAAVSAFPFEAVHIFRPSFLVGERSETRVGERIGIAVAAGLEFMLVGGLKKYRAIPAATVAAAMVAASKTATRGVHVYHWKEMTSLAPDAGL